VSERSGFQSIESYHGGEFRRGHHLPMESAEHPGEWDQVVTGPALLQHLPLHTHRKHLWPRQFRRWTLRRHTGSPISNRTHVRIVHPIDEVSSAGEFPGMGYPVMCETGLVIR
jgi:hypothetical protein